MVTRLNHIVCIWLIICVIEVPYSLHCSTVALFCCVFYLTVGYFIYVMAMSLINWFWTIKFWCRQLITVCRLGECIALWGEHKQVVLCCRSACASETTVSIFMKKPYGVQRAEAPNLRLQSAADSEATRSRLPILRAANLCLRSSADSAAALHLWRGVNDNAYLHVRGGSLRLPN